jgi:hypothetical protein
LKKVLIKSGWLGRNGLDWYSAPDDLGEQVYALYHELVKSGYDVKMCGDLSDQFEPDLEIHLDRQRPHNKSAKKILVYLEPDFVQPQNLFFPLLNYDLIFTLKSDEDLDHRHRRYVYPRSLKHEKVPEFEERDILISCIAGNKNAVVQSPWSLYGERQKQIAMLDDSIGEAFHLYGGGWELVDHKNLVSLPFCKKVSSQTSAAEKLQGQM